LSEVNAVASVMRACARYDDTEFRMKAARHILNQVRFHVPTATAIANFSVNFDLHYLPSIEKFKINVQSVMKDCGIASSEARRLLIASECDPVWATVTYRSTQVDDDTKVADVLEPRDQSATLEDDKIEECECIVCMEPILVTTACILLPCRETSICSICATSWKKKDATCPKCRTFIDGIVVQADVHMQLSGTSRLLKWATHLAA